MAWFVEALDLWEKMEIFGRDAMVFSFLHHDGGIFLFGLEATEGMF